MTDIAFLSSAPHIAETMRALLAQHRSDVPVRIAVAFWGRGAEDLIASSSVQYRIVCNLSSGGTNPAVVRSLRSRTNITVLQLDSLHAKVLVCDAGAVVSSANFSTNGLGLEGLHAQTWDEAGISLPASLAQYGEIARWFDDLWRRARPITDDDLDAADLAWSRRPLAPSKIIDVESTDTNDNSLHLFRTIEFRDRAPMQQVYLRSAAAILALGGCDGRPMASSSFKFLFTQRAFRHHHSKFREEGQELRLQEQYVGYFIGANGTISMSSNPGRLKAYSDEVVNSVAGWMRGVGAKPAQLDGTVTEARFFIR